MTTVRKTIITIESRTPEQISGSYGIKSREIYRRIETGAVQFAENTNGAVVCVISLKADGGK
jgi:hypothetical protein